MGSCYNVLVCMGSYITTQKKEIKGEEEEERSGGCEKERRERKRERGERDEGRQER